MKLEGLKTDLTDAFRTVGGGKPYNNGRTADSKEKRLRLQNASYQVIGCALVIIISISLIHATISQQPGRALLFTVQGILTLDTLQWSRNGYHNANPETRAEKRLGIAKQQQFVDDFSMTSDKRDALIGAQLNLADTILFLPLYSAMIKLTN